MSFVRNEAWEHGCFMSERDERAPGGAARSILFPRVDQLGLGGGGGVLWRLVVLGVLG